jgi:hypothetical protein
VTGSAVHMQLLRVYVPAEWSHRIAVTFTSLQGHRHTALTADINIQACNASTAPGTMHAHSISA